MGKGWEEVKYCSERYRGEVNRMKRT